MLVHNARSYDICAYYTSFLLPLDPPSPSPINPTSAQPPTSPTKTESTAIKVGIAVGISVIVVVFIVTFAVCFTLRKGNTATEYTARYVLCFTIHLWRAQNHHSGLNHTQLLEIALSTQTEVKTCIPRGGWKASCVCVVSRLTNSVPLSKNTEVMQSYSDKECFIALLS